MVTSSAAGKLDQKTKLTSVRKTILWNAIVWTQARAADVNPEIDLRVQTFVQTFLLTVMSRRLTFRSLLLASYEVVALVFDMFTWLISHRQQAI